MPPPNADVAQADMSTAISVRGLGKSYQIYDRPQDRLWQALFRGRRKYYKDFWALHDCTFDIQRGERVGIIGRNGSGKSTLLQLIAGTLAPTTGQVSVNGRVAALLELGSGFNPDFTGRENVYLNASILGLSQQEIDGRFDQITAFADIGQFIEQPVRTYSSGMVLRLAFAVSVCVDPDILIVDEALAVGDMAFQLKCMERLAELTQTGTTLLFVSHDIATVKAYCQRSIYLANGKMKAMGSASDMVEHYLLDMRDGQRKELGELARVQAKPALGSHETSFAFGTQQGHVRKACFSDTQTTQYAFSTGDSVRVYVDVEYDPTVRHPAVSIVLHDYRMVDLSGCWFPVKNATMDGDIARAALEIEFPANLNSGQFFLTVRLEDRISDERFYPIDKQVGALCLQVIRPASVHFIGLVQFPFSATAVAPQHLSP